MLSLCKIIGRSRSIIFRASLLNATSEPRSNLCLKMKMSCFFDQSNKVNFLNLPREESLCLLTSLLPLVSNFIKIFFEVSAFGNVFTVTGVNPVGVYNSWGDVFKFLIIFFNFRNRNVNRLK